MHAVVADDDRIATAILERSLARWGVDVTVVHDGDAAWRVLTAEATPDLAIVDWMMPGIDGIELCRRIRASPALASLYVLLLTGRASRADLVAGLDAGADDYMVKPIDAEELRARVHVGTRVVTLQRRLTERVSELQLARDHLARLASTDALTKLYSRRWWFELATIEYARSLRSDRGFSMLAIDIDFFKTVNDTFGHEAGDRVLQQFADVLRSESRQGDIVGRIGGEEFALLLPETSLGAAEILARRITESCRTMSVVTARGTTVRVTCSTGVTEMTGDDDSLEAVLRRADSALYDAKRSGRDCWRCEAPPRPAGDALASPQKLPGDGSDTRQAPPHDEQFGAHDSLAGHVEH
jgi:two-component system cell cycle response regulator